MLVACDIDPYVNYLERQPGTKNDVYNRLSGMYNKLRQTGLYAGNLSYEQIMSYFD